MAWLLVHCPTCWERGGQGTKVLATPEMWPVSHLASIWKTKGANASGRAKVWARLTMQVFTQVDKGDFPTQGQEEGHTEA